DHEVRVIGVHALHDLIAPTDDRDAKSLTFQVAAHQIREPQVVLDQKNRVVGCRVHISRRYSMAGGACVDTGAPPGSRATPPKQPHARETHRAVETSDRPRMSGRSCKSPGCSSPNSA